MSVKFNRGTGTIEMNADADEVDEKLSISHIDIAATVAGTFKFTEKSSGALIGQFVATASVMDKSIKIERMVNGIVASLTGGAAGTALVYLKKKP